MASKLSKRIVNGNKLIENLQAMENAPPYADSILESARYNKMRILEAHISNYSDDGGVRAQRINETDPATGRSALHYLAYLGNTDIIQLLGATDQLKMNGLDARDRTCMHYAAIKGKSTLINTLFLLFKSHGGVFRRAELDPEAKEQRGVPAELTDLEKLNADIEKKSLEERLPKMSKFEEDGGDAEVDEDGAAEDEDPVEEENKSGEGSARIDSKARPDADPECAEEQDNKVPENKTPEATEFGQSEQALETRMLREMDRADGHHVDGAAFDPLERDEGNIERGGHAQTSMRGLVNFRDFKGRTALHVAVIWGNKAACETLLYLKANPLIEDGAGYRPIDYVDPDSAIADLLRNWMSRSTPAALQPFGEYEHSIKSGALLKAKMVNAVEAKKGGPATSGLDLPDLKQLSAESLQTLRLGDTKDNYFQAAIKAKKLESAIYLKCQVGGFPITH